MNIPLNNLSRYERGVNNPGIDFLVDLCAKFGVSLDWLVLGKDEPLCRKDTDLNLESKLAVLQAENHGLKEALNAYKQLVKTLQGNSK